MSETIVQTVRVIDLTNEMMYEYDMTKRDALDRTSAALNLLATFNGMSPVNAAGYITEETADAIREMYAAKHERGEL